MTIKKHQLQNKNKETSVAKKEMLKMIKYIADPTLDMYGYLAQKNRAEAEKAVEKTEMNKRDFVPPSIMLSGEFKEIESIDLFS